jgi:hypothetical protein
MMDGFWAAVDSQLELLRTARTAGEVLAICPGDAGGCGFFAGGGGDATVLGALREAGWRTVDYRAEYYWCAEAPDGSLITYVEGDLYRGNTLVG